MLTLAIQCISTRALRSDSEHAEWQTCDPQRGIDYSDHASVAEGAASLEADADGDYQYRIVEVASIEDSYLELRAENEDALEALATWVAAGCPRGGSAIQAVERAALACVTATPVKLAADHGRAA